MNTYWILVVVIVLISSVVFLIHDNLLIRIKSLLLRLLLNLVTVWIGIILPIAGINFLYRRYQENLFYGARGTAVAVLLICTFLSHIIFLWKKEKEVARREDEVKAARSE